MFKTFLKPLRHAPSYTQLEWFFILYLFLCGPNLWTRTRIKFFACIFEEEKNYLMTICGLEFVAF